MKTVLTVLSCLLLCSCYCVGPDGIVVPAYGAGPILPVGYNNPVCYGTSGSYGGGYYPVYNMGGCGGYGWGGGGYGWGGGGIGWNNGNTTINYRRTTSINNSGNTTYTGGTYAGGSYTGGSYARSASYSSGYGGGGYGGYRGGGYGGGGYGGGYRGR